MRKSKILVSLDIILQEARLDFTYMVSIHQPLSRTGKDGPQCTAEVRLLNVMAIDYFVV